MQSNKITSKFAKITSHTSYCDDTSEYNNVCECRSGNSPEERSALAFLNIQQLIDVAYGGYPNTQETYDEYTCHIIIEPDCGKGYEFYVIEHPKYSEMSLIRFRDEKQAHRFLEHDENILLLKDYFMVS